MLKQTWPLKLEALKTDQAIKIRNCTPNVVSDFFQVLQNRI